MEPPIVQVGVIAAAVVGLWVGARLLVDAAVRLAWSIGLSELTIGLTIVAVGTSMPELVVTADAAATGFGDIAVGNVFGSNIYNLAGVLGIVAVVRPVRATVSLVRRDGLVLLVSTAIGALVAIDLTVTRLEGAFLLALLVGYTAILLRSGRAAHTAPEELPTTPVETSALADRISGRGRDVLFVVAGLVIVLASGDALVRTASALARDAGLSEFVIGGTVVAAGTATPEVAVSLVALRQGSQGLSVGSIIGSNVFNTLGVLGVGAIISPLSVSEPALETLGWLVVISVALVGTLWTGRGLSRIEGGLFVVSECARWLLGLFGPPT
jgi:cation:H+ antiporter